MRRYPAEAEQKIRMQARVREWTASGLLAAEQGSAIDARLRTDLKRTNGFLRAAFALFSLWVVASAAWLPFVMMRWSIRDGGAAIILLVEAAASFGLAEYLTGSRKFYRYGVEEALGVTFAIQLTASALLAMDAGYRPSGEVLWIVALSVAATAAFILYLRFGFVYAAVLALGCLASIPFALHVSAMTSRALAAATCGVAFGAAYALHRRTGDDYPGDEFDTLTAVAWTGVYVALNLHLFGRGVVPRATSGDELFYWTIYALTWLLPAAGLIISVRDRHRSLLMVSVVMALATLATNKPYLGWPQHTWDPMLLGLLLIGVALGLRRWLASGPGGERAGFTPLRILEADRRALDVAAMASVTFGAPAPPDAAPPSGFTGGRSGGAGGGASY